jgi:hypothetical protein
MTTPGGCLRVLTQTLMQLARNADVEGFSVRQLHYSALPGGKR